MMRSLFSGVSGLNNHQTRMDVIGHNVSNVNTHGYKKGRVTFQDLLSQRISGAARPREERGGINPKQVGLGMQIAAIDTIHNQGALQTTGVNTDLAVVGNGFFVNRSGESLLYTRAGAYSLDADGVLVNQATGYRVQGFQARSNLDGSVSIDTSSSIDDLVIPLGQKQPAEPTENVTYRSNLNLLTPVIPPNASESQILAGNWRTSIKVYDSRGEPLELVLNFFKNTDANGVEIPNQWRVTTQVFDMDTNPIGNVVAQTNPNDVTNDFIVQFNTAGAPQSLIDPINGTVVGAAGDALEIALNFTVPGSDPSLINLSLGTSGLYDGITQFASTSTTRASFQDGTALGYLENFNINDNGVIVGSYTNGTRRDLGQVALAAFVNPGGLEREGETYFSETNNSGQAQITAPNTQGIGKIKAGTLEMSNVDLAEQFTDMIVTQRGFQANSRSITTSDIMLEEVLRLKS
ncbi:flagellar hook protein FlgE [Spirochaetota bacterium]|nr:flagellar hook protein FlgE [Spirochaetota bacterium]